MTDSTSGRTPPSKRLNSQLRPEQGATASPGKNKRSRKPEGPERRVSPGVASLLTEPETPLMRETDNIGLEELVAALTRIPLRRRGRH